MWARRVESPSAESLVDEYAGLYYSDELLAVYEIAEDGSGFVVRNAGFRSRSLQPAWDSSLVGGIGVMTFIRGDDGRAIGFDFSEPEDFSDRSIRFARCEIYQEPGSVR
jgi:hypothetical protein